MTETLLNNPVIQYGFAGLCVLQLGVIVWLINQQLKTMTTMLQAFDRNTSAYRDLIAMLSTRPCLHNDRIFTERRET